MFGIAGREAEKGHVFLKSKRKLFNDLKTAHSKDTENLEKLFFAYLSLAVVTELQNNDEITTPEKKIKKVVGTLFEDLEEDESEDSGLVYLKHNVPTCREALSFFETTKKAFGALKWKMSFGGKEWRDIADKVLMRLKGEIDAVVFVDVIFDIEHHSGHVFDKHENIRCDGKDLNVILETKRDSSLEEMYKKFTHEYKYVSPRVKALYARGVTLEWWKEAKNGKAKKDT